MNSCEYRSLATIIYLDYLFKNNILNIIVGCFLIFDSLLVCQVCPGQNSNGSQSIIAWIFNINSMCNPNVFTISRRYLCYFVLHCLQRYKSVYKLMLIYYYYWNMCSLLILLHVYLHVHILKITYYISWLTGTLQRQYLQLKHNTVTDIDSRTIELYAPLNNLISLRQQWIGYNIYKQTVMTVTRIITYYVSTSKMGAYMFLIMNLYCNVYCTVHWVIFFLLY